MRDKIEQYAGLLECYNGQEMKMAIECENFIVILFNNLFLLICYCSECD